MVFLPLLSPVIAMLILWLVQAGFLYIAGSAVSEEGTKVTDALIVAAIGSLAYEAALWAFGVWVSPLMEVYPMLLFWLLLGGALVAIYVPLIMHFFDTSFGGGALGRRISLHSLLACCRLSVSCHLFRADTLLITCLLTC